MSAPSGAGKPPGGGGGGRGHRRGSSVGRKDLRSSRHHPYKRTAEASQDADSGAAEDVTSSTGTQREPARTRSTAKAADALTDLVTGKNPVTGEVDKTENIEDTQGDTSAGEIPNMPTTPVLVDVPPWQQVIPMLSLGQVLTTETIRAWFPAIKRNAAEAMPVTLRGFIEAINQYAAADYNYRFATRGVTQIDRRGVAHATAERERVYRELHERIDAYYTALTD